MSVSICVEVGYELHCLIVTDAAWQMIKTGVPFADTLESSYEGEKFSYQFSFNSGYKGQLSVDYSGDDDYSSGEGFSGSLEDAHINFDND
ncbi:hypothetical protein OAI21_00115 [Oceanospirillaceae bacterium]|nr:hypothetical protein [Oceanospirillaceae bacterium]